MNRTSKLANFLFITSLLLSSLAAQIPGSLAYQGMLSDSLGVPKPDDSYSFTFKLYDAATGGTALWTEAKTLAVKDGLFYTLLGDPTPFDETLLFDQPYWLGIKVGTEPELVPRISLASVAYSFRALIADSSNIVPWSGITGMPAGFSDGVDDTGGGHSLDAADGDPIDAVFVDSLGNVGIGTTTPGAKLEVAGQVKITGGTPGADKVLTSDAAGLATWQTPSSGGDLSYGSSAASPSDAVFVDDGGNVGIGTSTPADSAKLHIMGKLFINSPTHSNEEVHIAENPGSSDAVISLEHTSGRRFEFHSNYDGTFQIKDGDAAPGVSALMTFDAPNTRIGIGKSTGIAAMLHIDEDLDREVARFESDEGNLVVVDKDGNVGIGTTSPATALDVAGTVTADSLAVSGGVTVAGVLAIGGGQRVNVDTVNTNYMTTTSDRVILVSAGADITLHSAASSPGQVISISNVDYNSWTTIYGSGDFHFENNGGAFDISECLEFRGITVVSDGTGWYIISCVIGNYGFCM